jgi:uncharacterized radical SAM protein YgiQ
MLPVRAKEVKGPLDAVILTGDAYVDHPAFGAALVGRLLESCGLGVGIVAQPDWHGTSDFKALGEPRLFFGITAGCVDSMVANASALKGRRRRDDYSPGGSAGLRPDRACVVYANRVHQAFGGSFIILGGIEASTRRLAHYDYWEDDVRRSILVDAGADIIVYGMAEPVLPQVVRWLSGARDRRDLFTLRGIVFSIPVRDEWMIPPDALRLPSFREVRRSRDLFFETHLVIGKESGRRIIVQPHDDRIVIQTPPSCAVPEDLDRVFSLPFTRRPHPGYGREIPALNVVRSSLTGHRGCTGDCSFCVLSLCQGRRVVSRSAGSILAEAAWLARQDFFDGVITDVGGPTADMYRLACKKNGTPGSCDFRRCLFPKICPNLIVDHTPQMELIRKLKRIPGVKHVYISSGVRYDLVLADPAYLDFLIKENVAPGQLSVAPEHVSDRILRLMRKPPLKTWNKFERLFYARAVFFGKKYYLVPYYISSFPGATLEDAFILARRVQGSVSYIRQIQDFTPIPMSDAACMYYSEKDLEGRKIFVAKTREEKLMQRALVQFRSSVYKPWARRALGLLGKSMRDLAL